MVLCKGVGLILQNVGLQYFTGKYLILKHLERHSVTDMRAIRSHCCYCFGERVNINLLEEILNKATVGEHYESFNGHEFNHA